MARIAGIDIPKDKHVEIALTYIYGIGRPQSKKILQSINVRGDVQVKDLTDDEVNKIRDYINQNLKVEGDLRRDVSQNLKRLMEISSYRGLRHRRGLPVRGQRTHTNARTRKGKPKTVGIKSKK